MYAGDFEKFEKICQKFKIYLQAGKTADVLIQSWRVELKTPLHRSWYEYWSWYVSGSASLFTRNIGNPL